MYCWNLTNYDGDWGDWYEAEYTIEDCLKSARDTNRSDYDNKYDTVLIGELVDCVPHVNADDILESLQEYAYDEWGEAGEDWNAYDYRKVDELKELSEELDNVIHKWMKKYHYYPNFAIIENIKEYPL